MAGEISAILSEIQQQTGKVTKHIEFGQEAVYSSSDVAKRTEEVFKEIMEGDDVISRRSVKLGLQISEKVTRPGLGIKITIHLCKKGFSNLI